uniref:VWFA domain-containing protein n=1 Tax=Magallana gigas TaxID=29159 RepID=A0A8W8JZG9_MAGGI
MNVSRVFLIFISAIQLTSSMKDCKTAPKDVVFLLDTSGSVGLSNFNMTLKAIKSFISMFDIGPSNTRVGIETFATTVNHQFALGDHQTVASLITAIDKIPYQTGGTQITTALAYAATNSFKTGGRRLADKILILVTDGRSYDINSTVIQANNLQKQGINVFCLGVGAYVDIEELQAITKHRSRVLQVQDFNTLSHFIGNFRSTVCKAQKTTPFYLKEAFHWIEYVEVGILSLVTVVVVGSLSCFCRFCFFFLKKREDDSEERKPRRKPCKRPAGWPT